MSLLEKAKQGLGQHHVSDPSRADDENAVITAAFLMGIYPHGNTGEWCTLNPDSKYPSIRSTMTPKATQAIHSSHHLYEKGRNLLCRNRTHYEAAAKN